MSPVCGGPGDAYVMLMLALLFYVATPVGLACGAFAGWAVAAVCVAVPVALAWRAGRRRG